MTDRGLVWPAPKMQTFEQRLANLVALSAESFPYRHSDRRVAHLLHYGKGGMPVHGALQTTAQRLASLTSPSESAYPYKRAAEDVFTREAKAFWALYEEQS